ncbi:PIN domain-containing protein [Candidatus Uhrbacteria bacterium]|nr:PIN domain-containing protein [Candidatus Uhrbacteria bacterium]
MTFVDTSALYALADRRDDNHARAKKILQELLRRNEEFFTHNYIIVETVALIQRRLGFSVAEAFLRDTALFSLFWIDERIHHDTATLFASLKKRTVSFVDCTSFFVMKQRGVRHAFAFDGDFLTQGFILVNEE